MWFDGIRQPNTLYVASVSRGKDSTAMLEAIKLMGWPLDMIVSVDIWFDDTTPAELPPMVAFKDEWDAKCLERYGVPVTRLCATKRERDGSPSEECHPRESYTSYFYRKRETGANIGATVGFPMQRGSWCKKLKYEQVDLCGYILSAYEAEAARERERRRKEHPIYGFPQTKGNWCTADLKNSALRISNITSRYMVSATQNVPFSKLPHDEGQKISIVNYTGIASDEHKRIARHMPKKDMVLPLVQIGWEEDLCGLIATYLDMLAPTYTTSMRDGCWFCHNQGVPQLRNLRKNYPDLWEKLLKLDNDSPVTFKADGHTVHDFDRRFQLEDEGLIDPTKPFKWKMLDMELNYSLFNN